MQLGYFSSFMTVFSFMKNINLGNFVLCFFRDNRHFILNIEVVSYYNNEE